MRFLDIEVDPADVDPCEHPGIQKVNGNSDDPHYKCFVCGETFDAGEVEEELDEEANANTTNENKT